MAKLLHGSTTAVAKGDLSQKIDVHARGEIAELKVSGMDKLA